MYNLNWHHDQQRHHWRKGLFPVLYCSMFYLTFYKFTVYRICIHFASSFLLKLSKETIFCFNMSGQLYLLCWFYLLILSSLLIFQSFVAATYILPCLWLVTHLCVIICIWLKLDTVFNFLGWQRLVDPDLGTVQKRCSTPLYIWVDRMQCRATIRQLTQYPHWRRSCRQFRGWKDNRIERQKQNIL